MYDERAKKTLMLMAYILNWSEANINELILEGNNFKANDLDLMRLFFSDISNLETESFLPQIKYFWAIQDILSCTSPYSNFMATVYQAVTAALKPLIFKRRCFEEHLLALFSGAVGGGPYRDLFYNTLIIIYKNKVDIELLLGVDSFQDLDQPEPRARARAQALEQALDRVLNWDREQALREQAPREQALEQALEQARNLDRNLARNRDLDRDLPLALALDRARARARNLALDLDLDLDLNLNRDRDRDRDRDRGHELYRVRRNNYEFWQTVLATPELYNHILDKLCDIFDLEPQSQWKESLRVAFLPKVPQRISLMFDKERWKQSEHTFAEGRIDESEMYSASLRLLLDVWLYIYKIYQSPEESIFDNIAKLTRNIDYPPLRIAHCIRDLTYGDQSRIGELAAMVQSDDPEYRSIFERCLLRPTPDEAKREAEEAKIEKVKNSNSRKKKKKKKRK